MPIICIVIYLYIIHMYYCVIMSIIKHNVFKGQEEIVHKSSIISLPTILVSVVTLKTTTGKQALSTHWH